MDLEGGDQGYPQGRLEDLVLGLCYVLRPRYVLASVCTVITADLRPDIDRSNIKNATADNFLKDLNLTQGDYNLGNTLSKLGFLCAELPSQLVSKRLGPDRWIPMQIVIFSVLSGAQFWLNGRAFFFATRFLM